jgi:hypothetical protein
MHSLRALNKQRCRNKNPRLKVDTHLQRSVAFAILRFIEPITARSAAYLSPKGGTANEIQAFGGPKRRLSNTGINPISLCNLLSVCLNTVSVCPSIPILKEGQLNNPFLYNRGQAYIQPRSLCDWACHELRADVHNAWMLQRQETREN